MFPLRGQVLCGECARPLTGAITTKKNGLQYPYYYCSSGLHYSRSIIKDDFEGEYLAFMGRVEPKQDLVILFSEMVKEKWQSRYFHLTERQNSVNRELEALYEVRKKLGQKHLQGIYSDEVFQEQLHIIEDEILVKKAIKSEAKLQEIDIDTLANFMNNFLWNIGKAWQEGTLEERKMLTGSIFPENLIYDFPGFRTAKLGRSFGLMQQFEGTKPSLWVTERIRTADILLHRQALYR